MRVLEENGVRFCDFRVQVYDCEGSTFYYHVHLAGFIITTTTAIIQLLLLLYRVPAPHKKKKKLCLKVFLT